MDEKIGLKSRGTRGEGDDDSTESDTEEYSLLYLVPVLSRVLRRFVTSLPVNVTKLCYRVILLIGDLWLGGTYLLLLTLRGIGRFVLILPFFVLVCLFRLLRILGQLFIRLLGASGAILECIGDSVIGLVRFVLHPDPKAVIASIRRIDAGSFISRTGKAVLSAWTIRWELVTADIHRLSIHRAEHYVWAKRQYAWHLAGASAGVCVMTGLVGLFYVEIIRDMPNPFTLRKVELTASTRIMDRDGRVLYNVYGGENRTLVKLSDLPAHVPLATMAIEDVDFFYHNGISLRGMMRAAKTNFLGKNGEGFQGGSTITQQLVKNLLLSPERTWRRKVKEIILSMAMEAHFSKAEIMQMYLNEVAYGGPHYGIEEASEYYFGKSAKYLTLAETALIAGLPTQPSRNSPFVDPQAARDRQHLVLKRMVDNHFITAEEANQAREEKLVFVPQAIPIKAPHFVMLVRQALIDRFGEKIVNEGGLQVYTTLDLNIQTMAERYVRENINKIKLSHNVGNGAAMVTKPQTGEVLAMVGSVDYFDPKISGQVNMVTARRQPGSSIKPVNYSYAFDHLNLTPGSTVDDSPVVYQIAGSEAYAPVNYDGKFKGRMTIRSALAESRNIPAVRTLERYGPRLMVEQGQRLGITTWDTPDQYGLSLTLGAAEVRMIDMATVYGTFANMGIRRDPVLIAKVLDANGRVLVDNTGKTKSSFFTGFVPPAQADETNSLFVQHVSQSNRVLSKIAAYWITNILSDNKARMPAFGQYARLEVPGHTVAVKTGTTNSFRDNWTIGYTPDYLVAAWVGNTDNKPMNSNLVSGITGAAPIWNDIMTNLLKNIPDRVWAAPEDMISVQICATNGLLTCPYCPLTTTEYFVKGSEPKQACSFESPDACASRRAQAEADHKSPEEIAKMTANCTQPAPTKNP